MARRGWWVPQMPNVASSRKSRSRRCVVVGRAVRDTPGFGEQLQLGSILWLQASSMCSSRVPISRKRMSWSGSSCPRSSWRKRRSGTWNFLTRCLVKWFLLHHLLRMSIDIPNYRSNSNSSSSPSSSCKFNSKWRNKTTVAAAAAWAWAWRIPWAQEQEVEEVIIVLRFIPPPTSPSLLPTCSRIWMQEIKLQPAGYYYPKL